MKTSPLLGWFALLLIAACNSPKQTNDSMPVVETETHAEFFQQLIDSMYAKHPDTKGFMMHVEAPDQDISWTGAIGIHDQASQNPIKPHDPALIASNTKTHVAVAILRLVEQGHFGLHDPVSGLITEKSEALLKDDGYDLQAITVAHLLSHTSGMFDYVNSKVYLDRTVAEPDYEWTRDEQIELSVTDGAPLGAPGKLFSYSELNYLLLTEMMELKTGKPFHLAMRELLKYEELGLNETWFNLLEEAPPHLAPKVQQYATKFNVDSYSQHGTFDLYGGGGIVATTRDLALFSQHLFENRIFDSPETLKLIYTEIPTKDGVPADYYMGLAKTENAGRVAYGHGGFWGTTVKYVPSINASIAVYVLERDSWELYNQVIDAVVVRLAAE